MPKTDYAESLLAAIDTIATKRVSSVAFDQTLKCTITDNSSAGSGKYKVTDGSVTFDAYVNDSSYRVDDQVYVLIPEGDFKQQKMIIGKYTADNENEPYIYESPFDQLVDMTGNLIQINIEKKYRQLRANNKYEKIAELISHRTDFTEDEFYKVKWNLENENECRKLLWSQEFDGTVENEYTRLGVQAEFSSWLNTWDVISGNYGLNVRVYGTEFEKEDAAIYEFTLDVSDMYGNPYDFEAYYTQETAFDISGIQFIHKIELWFFEDSTPSFYYRDGQETKIVPYTGTPPFYSVLAPNLFVREPYLCLGYDKADLENELIKISTLDSLTYDQLPSDELYKNNKTITLSWIHMFDNGAGRVNSYKDLDFDEIRWYRYNPGAMPADSTVSNHWEYLPISDYLMSDIEIPMKVEKSVWNMLYNNSWYIATEDGAQKLYQVSDENQFDSSKHILLYLSTFSNNDNITNKIKIFNEWANDTIGNHEEDREIIQAWLTKTIPNYQPQSSLKVAELLQLVIPTQTWGSYSNGLFTYISLTTLPTVTVRVSLAKVFLDQGALGKYKKLFTMILEPDTTHAIEKIQARVFYEGSVKKSNILEFENSQPVVNQKTLNLSDALELVCEDKSEGNYFWYDLGGNLWNSADANTPRTLSLKYYPEGRNESAAAIEDLEFIEWIIPHQTTMLTFPLLDEKYKDEIANNVGLLTQGLTIPIQAETDSETGVNLIITRLPGDRYTHFKYVYTSPSKGLSNGLHLSIGYKINRRYTNSDINNTVSVAFKQYDNTVSGLKEFNFGPKGSAGTRTTFFLEFADDATAIINKKGETIRVKARLFDDDNKEQDVTGEIIWGWKDLNIPENEVAEWESLNPFKINTSGDSSLCELEYRFDNPINLWQNKYILQASLTGWEDVTLTAYLPIAMKADVEGLLDEETFKNMTHIEGVTEIVYNSNGLPYTQPGDNLKSLRYYALYETTTDEWTYIETSQELSDITWKRYPLTDNEDTYLPKLVSTTIPLSSTDASLVKNVQYLLPAGIWVDDVRRDITICAFNKNDEPIWSQPILILQSNYPSQILNDWDGKLEIDEENNYILAAKIAAGKKNSDNTFSGVTLGAWNEPTDIGDTAVDATWDSGVTGLWGFHHGQTSFGFKDDGSAFIGKSGKGRIMFDGNNGYIASANWFKTNEEDSDGGFISASGQLTPGKRGMLIDLQHGHIDAYNFKLTSQGLYLNGNPQGIEYEEGVYYYADPYYLYLGDGASDTRNPTDPHVSFSKDGKLNIRANELSLTSGSIGSDNFLKKTEPHPKRIYNEYGYSATIYPVFNKTDSVWKAISSDIISYYVDYIENTEDTHEYGLAIIPRATTNSTYRSIYQNVKLKSNTSYTFSCEIYLPFKGEMILYPYDNGNNEAWDLKYIYLDKIQLDSLEKDEPYYIEGKNSGWICIENVSKEQWHKVEVTFTTKNNIPDNFNFCLGWDNIEKDGEDYFAIDNAHFLAKIYPRVAQTITVLNKEGTSSETSSQNIIENAVSAGFPWLLYHAKLEEGTVATGWTAHSEDVIIYASDGVEDLNNSYTQYGLFNKLTNNWSTQGLFLNNGELYINANHIAAGALYSQNWATSGGKVSDMTSQDKFSGGKIITRGSEGMAISLYDGHIDAHDLLMTGGSANSGSGSGDAYTILLCSQPGTGTPTRPNYYFYIGDSYEYISFDKNKNLKLSATNFYLKAGTDPNEIIINSNYSITTETSNGVTVTKFDTIPLKIGKYFEVAWDGTLTCTNGQFSGKIYAQQLLFWSVEPVQDSNGQWQLVIDTEKTSSSAGFNYNFLKSKGTYQLLNEKPLYGPVWTIEGYGTIGAGAGSTGDSATRGIRLAHESDTSEVYCGSGGARLSSYDAGFLQETDLYVRGATPALDLSSDSVSATSTAPIFYLKHQVPHSYIDENDEEQIYYIDELGIIGRRVLDLAQITTADSPGEIKTTYELILQAQGYSKNDHFSQEQIINNRYYYYYYGDDILTNTSIETYPNLIYSYIHSYVQKEDGDGEKEEIININKYYRVTKGSSGQWYYVNEITNASFEWSTNYLIASNWKPLPLIGEEYPSSSVLNSKEFTLADAIQNEQYEIDLKKYTAATAESQGSFARIAFTRSQLQIGPSQRINKLGTPEQFASPWEQWNEYIRTHPVSKIREMANDWDIDKYGKNPHGIELCYGLFIGGPELQTGTNNQMKWTEGVVGLTAKKGCTLWLNMWKYAYQASDRRLKKDIIYDLKNRYEEFFDNLKPCQFKYVDGDAADKKISFGFIAQEVEESLKINGYDREDFGIIVKDANNEYDTLNYNNFIALNTSQIQKLKNRVAQLEQELQELKEKLQ